MWVASAVGQAFEAVAARFALSPAQARALLLLADGLPMSTIADRLRCDASNVTGIADRLTARGLVTREPSLRDRRVKLLVLTGEGQRLRKELDHALSEASPVVAGLDPAERATLQRLLDKIVTNVAASHCPSQASGDRRR